MRKDWDAAVDAELEVFWREPDLENFYSLMGLARQANREKEIRAATKQQLRETGAPFWEVARRSFTLGQILRDEGDWQGSYEALMGRVQDPDRLCEAARWLRDPSPRLACKLYALAIDILIERKNKRGYASAATLLVEAKPSFDTIGPDEFDKHLALLRSAHKQKRSFMAVLDDAL
jgi:hypothetical protein